MKTKHAQKYRVARFVLSAFCLTATLMPLPALGADYGIVKGKITDKADGEGVYGASVSIAGTSIGTTTDMNGNFTLPSVPAKQQKISISIVGYAPASQVVTVANGQTYQINLQIGQTTIMASEVVVGASLYKQNRLDVPVTANVVSQEKIKQQANPTLDRVIEDVPGVVVTRAGGQTSSGVQIRGSNTYQGGGIGTRVTALYDGFPINAPESGEVAWSSVNMNAADKVEILKGAAATLYGSSAMGGVVNVFGHLPDKLEVKAGLNGGFYAQPPSTDQSVFYNDKHTPWFWNTYVGFGNKSGKLNYNILYTTSRDDGYRQNANTILDDIKLKVRYDIDASQYLLLSAFYNQTEGGYAYEWYTGDSFTVFTAHPERGYDINNNQYYYDDMIKRNNALVGLNYVNLISDNLSIDTRLFFTHNGTRYLYNTTTAPQISIPFYNKAVGDFNETYSNRFGAGTKIDWRANDNNRVLLGAEGSTTDVMTTQLTAQWPTANVLGDIREDNRALFVQDEVKVTDKLTSLLSLRYDWSGINADLAQSSAGGSYVAIEHKSVDAFSPRVALNFKAMDDMSLRASWGKSFRAPTLYERFVRSAGPYTGSPNPALNKETMTAYEVGMFKEFGDQLSLDIAGFLNNYNDLIESVITQSTRAFQYRNITKARIFGVETGLNYRPSSDLAFNAAYTYMKAKNRSYVAGADATNDLNPDPYWLAYRPEHTASAGATWKPTGKLSLNVNARYVSLYKSVTSHPNATSANYPGDFVIFNTGLKYQAAETASVSLLCKNIGNTQYEEAEWFRAPGRSYVAGVDFTF
ncbi:TonB-dependent receptor [Chlorobium ferrooxidans]|uniref:TonB-dependent receptor:TonB-dependent receptor, plug n=1 Tax=Chlorobium ferrooxidans DSM 13031 TaxID=377431 RepID=Q0YQQ8_9CHLB|nr:TonB-dependent receptor [Chlorobium ferrooxidans]EAT58666.1 TonB-dependent receptor:TonB-dependent receptor, plug [Chlorobium ferrooxidans DSM 13031]